MSSYWVLLEYLCYWITSSVYFHSAGNVIMVIIAIVFGGSIIKRRVAYFSSDKTLNHTSCFGIR